MSNVSNSPIHDAEENAERQSVREDIRQYKKQRAGEEFEAEVKEQINDIIEDYEEAGSVEFDSEHEKNLMIDQLFTEVVTKDW